MVPLWTCLATFLPPFSEIFELQATCSLLYLSSKLTSVCLVFDQYYWAYNYFWLAQQK